MRGESPQKAFPLGGRWPEGADEGAMIERFRSSQGNISPPAGGEFLSQRWERNQRIAGGRGRRALRANRTAYPRSPITGVTPLAWRWISGAQNQECLSAVPSGPTGGLSRREIGTGAVPLPRLPLPNQRYWCEFWRAHAMRPYWFPADCRGGYQPPESLPL